MLLNNKQLQIMKDETLIPLAECLDELRDKSSINITALHETGHVIVMYAMDMMDFFSYVTIKGGARQNEVNGGTDYFDGLTMMTNDYHDKLQLFENNLHKMANNIYSGKDKINYIRNSKMELARLYLPNVCRLFGGGAICRYYEVPNEAMCSKDHYLIDVICNEEDGLGLPGKVEYLRPIVDIYLTPIFKTLEPLTKAIYKNLIKKETLNKEQVMQIIEEWENFKC